MKPLIVFLCMLAVIGLCAIAYACETIQVTVTADVQPTHPVLASVGRSVGLIGGALGRRHHRHHPKAP